MNTEIKVPTKGLQMKQKSDTVKGTTTMQEAFAAALLKKEAEKHTAK